MSHPWQTWWRRWWPAVSIMALIFIASSIPGSDIPEMPRWDMFAKKGGHTLVYALLAVAIFRGLSRAGVATRGKMAASICFASLYALTDEFHQLFTPGRHASAWDVLIDFAGAVLGMVFLHCLRKCRCQRLPDPSSHSAGVGESLPASSRHTQLRQR